MTARRIARTTIATFQAALFAWVAVMADSFWVFILAFIAASAWGWLAADAAFKEVDR